MLARLWTISRRAARASVRGRRSAGMQRRQRSRVATIGVDGDDATHDEAARQLLQWKFAEIPAGSKWEDADFPAVQASIDGASAPAPANAPAPTPVPPPSDGTNFDFPFETFYLEELPDIFFDSMEDLKRMPIEISMQSVVVSMSAAVHRATRESMRDGAR